MGINAKLAFKNDAADDSYHSQLSVPDPEKETLRSARDDIRERLKAGLQNWLTVTKREVLFEAAAQPILALDGDPTLRPKFRMQGSWAYYTLNCTTHEPPQEIDLDDGMFLPISFLSQNGTVRPAIVSDAYFKAVEAILVPLCTTRGWTLDRSKPSCVRVNVCKGAHVDIALYAIPDQEFEALLEKAEHSAMAFDHELSFSERFYEQLPSDQIMLAHRLEGWKPSDPRKLETWFQDAIKRHDQQLRRVCRYLKGWRDSNWDKCRLSSIALMACVVDAYDQAATKPEHGRDDLALSMVAERLPEMLSGRIPNPVVDGQFLDENWGDDRSDFIEGAKRLAAALRNALTASKPEDARNKLVTEMGTYMPTTITYYVAESPGPTILAEGILKGLGTDEARAAVQLGGDDRYG